MTPDQRSEADRIADALATAFPTAPDTGNQVVLLAARVEELKALAAALLDTCGMVSSIGWHRGLEEKYRLVHNCASPWGKQKEAGT